MPRNPFLENARRSTFEQQQIIVESDNQQFVGSKQECAQVTEEILDEQVCLALSSGKGSQLQNQDSEIVNDVLNQSAQYSSMNQKTKKKCIQQLKESLYNSLAPLEFRISRLQLGSSDAASNAVEALFSDDFDEAWLSSIAR